MTESGTWTVSGASPLLLFAFCRLFEADTTAQFRQVAVSSKFIVFL